MPEAPPQHAKNRLPAVVMVAVYAFGAWAPQAEAQSPEISIGGRLQTQFNTTSVDGVAPSQLLIRRARIELQVQIDERISGVIQPDFGGGSVELKDAYVRVEVTPGLSVLTGRAYRPFGRLEQTSSKRMPVVERGLRIRGLGAADEYALVNGLDYSDRDIGVQFVGSPRGGRFGWAAGVFRGPLHGQLGDRHSYQLAGRVTTAPAPGLQLGAGWSMRDFSEGAAATLDVQRGHAFELDLEYGSFGPGFHLLAEVSRGDFDPFAGTTFTGAQLWAAWRTGKIHASGVQLEPLLRLSHASTREGDPPGGPGPGSGLPAGGTLITPGVNLYLTPLNRVMVNWDVWRGAGESPDARSLKVMVQMAF